MRILAFSLACAFSLTVSVSPQASRVVYADSVATYNPAALGFDTLVAVFAGIGWVFMSAGQAVVNGYASVVVAKEQDWKYVAYCKGWTPPELLGRKFDDQNACWAVANLFPEEQCACYAQLQQAFPTPGVASTGLPLTQSAQLDAEPNPEASSMNGQDSDVHGDEREARPAQVS